MLYKIYNFIFLHSLLLTHSLFCTQHIIVTKIVNKVERVHKYIQIDVSFQRSLYSSYKGKFFYLSMFIINFFLLKFGEHNISQCILI